MRTTIALAALTALSLACGANHGPVDGMMALAVEVEPRATTASAIFMRYAKPVDVSDDGEHMPYGCPVDGNAFGSIDAGRLTSAPATIQPVAAPDVVVFGARLPREGVRLAGDRDTPTSSANLALGTVGPEERLVFRTSGGAVPSIEMPVTTPPAMWLTAPVCVGRCPPSTPSRDVLVAWRASGGTGRALVTFVLSPSIKTYSCIAPISAGSVVLPGSYVTAPGELSISVRAIAASSARRDGWLVTAAAMSDVGHLTIPL